MRDQIKWLLAYQIHCFIDIHRQIQRTSYAKALSYPSLRSQLELHYISSQRTIQSDVVLYAIEDGLLEFNVSLSQ